MSRILAIQIIEPLIAKSVMCILRHIEFMQLVQHHSLKLRSTQVMKDYLVFF